MIRASVVALALTLPACGSAVDYQPPSSGCYPDTLACGAVVGRWCWSDAPDVAPEPGRVRYGSGAMRPAYWCCAGDGGGR